MQLSRPKVANISAFALERAFVSLIFYLPNIYCTVQHYIYTYMIFAVQQFISAARNEHGLIWKQSARTVILLEWWAMPNAICYP